MRITGNLRRQATLIGGAILLSLIASRTFAVVLNPQPIPAVPTCMDVIDLRVAGFFADTCWFAERIDLSRDGDTFQFDIHGVDRSAPGVGCLPVFVDYETTRRIGRLSPGSYRVRAQEWITSSRPYVPPEPREITMTVTGGINDVDVDGDGLSPCQGDCDDANPTAWSEPGEAMDLELLADAATLRWGPTAPGGTSSLRYDTLRSNGAGDFVNGAVCLESGDSSDMTSTDSQSPAFHRGFFYLVRAINGCPGTAGGGLGSNSSGIPRAGRTCP